MNGSPLQSADRPGARALGWVDARAAFWLIAAVAVARIVFLVAAVPFELAADEAHYWEWSRRLDWSYYSKGPGVAWSIAAATALFGDLTWAVRVPSVLFAAVAMVALWRLGTISTGGDHRAGFVAAACYALAPGYQVTSLMMTIDGPFLACWILAVWAAWHVLSRWTSGRSATGPLLMVAAALGAGFLFKYTILLLIPGLLVFAILWRKRLRIPRHDWAMLAVAVGLFALLSSPVMIWNARHDWPTVRHLLGALQLPGGDQPPPTEPGPAYSPLWTLELIGAQMGFLGPPLFVLVIIAVVGAMRRDRREATDVLMVCAGAPVLIFYLLVTFTHAAQGNWPIAGWISLLVVVGRYGVVELNRYATKVRDWLALPPANRPKAGWMRRKPETLFQVGWHWTIGLGIATAAGLVLVVVAAAIWPTLTEHKPLKRVMGHRAAAAAVHQHRQALAERTGVEPIIITDRYQPAGLLAFYLPDQPRTWCAHHHFGGRKTQYDYFADTDLDDAELRGRPALLIGARPGRWEEILPLVEVERLDAATHTPADKWGPLHAGWYAVE